MKRDPDISKWWFMWMGRSWTIVELTMVLLSFRFTENRLAKRCDDYLSIWGHTYSDDPSYTVATDLFMWWSFQSIRCAYKMCTYKEIDPYIEKPYNEPTKQMFGEYPMYRVFIWLYRACCSLYLGCNRLCSYILFFFSDPVNRYLKIRIFILWVTTYQYWLVTTPSMMGGCSYMIPLIRTALMICTYYTEFSCKRTTIPEVYNKH